MVTPPTSSVPNGTPTPAPAGGKEKPPNLVFLCEFLANYVEFLLKISVSIDLLKGQIVSYPVIMDLDLKSAIAPT